MEIVTLVCVDCSKTCKTIEDALKHEDNTGHDEFIVKKRESNGG